MHVYIRKTDLSVAGMIDTSDPATVASIVLGVVVVLLLVGLGVALGLLLPRSGAPRTLVVYCYREDALTKPNLQFFVDVGVFADPRVDFVILVNDKMCTVDTSRVGKASLTIIHVPKNDNDLGTYAWFLTTQNLSQYDAVYFINSSCRGPFVTGSGQTGLPPQKWTTAMNALLVQPKTGLVGPVLEVPSDTNGWQPEPHGPTDPATRRLTVPFIHTYMFGVSKAGLRVLQDVLKRLPARDKAAALRAERYITSAMFQAGLKVRTLTTRFSGVDMSDPSNWDAARWRPTPHDPLTTCYEKPGNYFGMDLHPFEVVFVKNVRVANDGRRQQDAGISPTLALQVDNYSAWMTQGKT